MQTFLVHVKPTKVNKETVHVELERFEVDSAITALEGTRDYVISPKGDVLKVVEKVFDLRDEGEMRILARSA